LQPNLKPEQPAMALNTAVEPINWRPWVLAGTLSLLLHGLVLAVFPTTPTDLWQTETSVTVAINQSHSGFTSAAKPGTEPKSENLVEDVENNIRATEKPGQETEASQTAGKTRQAKQEPDAPKSNAPFSVKDDSQITDDFVSAKAPAEILPTDIQKDEVASDSQLTSDNDTAQKEFSSPAENVQGDPRDKGNKKADQLTREDITKPLTATENKEVNQQSAAKAKDEFLENTTTTPIEETTGSEKYVMPEIPTTKNSEPPNPGTKAAMHSVNEPQSQSASSGKCFKGGATYPKRALRRKLEGQVVLEIQVSELARINQINIKESSGHSVLDKAAINQANKYKLRPNQLSGMAVSGVITCTVKFKINQ